MLGLLIAANHENNSIVVVVVEAEAGVLVVFVVIVVLVVVVVVVVDAIASTSRGAVLANKGARGKVERDPGMKPRVMSPRKAA